MLELFLNVVIIALVAAPLAALARLRKYVRWIDERHDGLSVIVWLATLAFLYAIVLPHLHMAPGPRFFDEDPPSW